jgi:hypothetical protein
MAGKPKFHTRNIIGDRAAIGRNIVIGEALLPRQHGLKALGIEVAIIDRVTCAAQPFQRHLMHRCIEAAVDRMGVEKKNFHQAAGWLKR